MESIDRKTKGMSLGDHLRTVSRHKFLVIIPVIAIFFGSAILGSTLPKLYKAEGVFRVTTPTTDQWVRPKYREGEQLKVMKEIILGRGNLLDVIKEVGLDASYANLPESEREAHEEQLVQRFRKNLDVEEKAKDVFRVSYRGEDPDLVARVANAVINLYIKRILGEEKDSMAATVTFLDRKVKEYQEKVSESSEALEKFKAAHILELPGTDLSESAALRRILDDLRTAEQELSDAETTKKEIEKQMLAVDPVAVGETVVKANPEVARYRARLHELELELAQLKTVNRFTDAHPDVIKKKREIETHKALIEKTAAETTTEEKRQANPLYLSLQERLKQSEVKIASTKRSKDALLAKKADCEKRVQNAPALEKEMANLTNADTQNREHLNYYTTQLLNARIDQEREIDQKGTRFRVQDYAKKPSSSEKSSRLKILLIGLLVGGGLGLGMAVLKDQMDTSFKNVQDAASFLDIPIVGTIPVITTTLEKAREKKKETIGWIAVGALATLLLAAMIVVTFTSFPGR